IIHEAQTATFRHARLEDSVDNDVRDGIATELADQKHPNGSLTGSGVLISAVAEFIVVYVYPVKIRIIVRVCKGYVGKDGHRNETDHAKTHHIISIDRVTEDFGIPCCHEEDSGTGRCNGGESAFHREVVTVVVDDQVVKNPRLRTILR